MKTLKNLTPIAVVTIILFACEDLFHKVLESKARQNLLIAMNKYLLFLGLAIVLLTSCKDDEALPALQLTADLVTSVKAYDLDNNGNSSDIRVDFIVDNNLNVTEYRIMVVPSSSISSFNQSIAISIPEGNFLKIIPASSNNEYSITRLPSNLFDVNGEQIPNDLTYVIAILVVGTGNHQLSEFSTQFFLTDQGIYNGAYLGSQDVKFIDFVGTNTANCQPRNFLQSISLSISETQQGSYRTDLICPNCDELFMDQGEITFMISNNIISNLIFNQDIVCFNGNTNCAICVFEVDPCSGLFPGQGIVIDELTLEIDLTGENCYGSYEIKLIVTRQ